MFFGTTPKIVSQFVFKELSERRPKKVIVPFAGNFVIEQLAGIVDKEIEVLSTDVSLYSRAIGFGLTDKESEIKIKDHIKEQFKCFDKELSPEELAGSIIFMSEMSTCMSRSKVKYYADLLHDGIVNQDKYFSKILKSIQNFKKNIGNMTFLGIDGVEVSRMAEKDDFLFYDPPVILGDYEKMFKHLEECYDFVTPEYTQMTDAVKKTDMETFTKKKVVCFYRNNNPLPDKEIPKGYSEVFRYRYKHHASYCVYSNRPKNTFVGRISTLKETVINYQIIGKNDIITENSEVQIVKAPGNVANHYRLMWVKKAEMSNGGTSYLIFVDKKLIGVATISSGMMFSIDLASIFSDPAAPTSRYSRLSKLIIYLICSRETLELINKDAMWHHSGFTTRVFTNNNVSMKYRSLFRLVKREEVNEGFYKTCLIYQNRDKITETWKESLNLWLSKDGQITK